ncbi:MAG: endolytic transglycosylase MltG [Actinobacteria bacterium]|nr:endolytic transglycosylase MltG [Actinomycetota bacterium]
MAEPGDGLKPPRLWARRLVALAGVGVVVAVVLALVLSLHGGSKAAAPTTTSAIPPPKPFKIVFPEGFTRAQMAQRVGVVAKIALHEHRGRPHLSTKGYLAASAPRRIPGFGAKTLPLEGFLFPALYDFLPKTTNTQLVGSQLRAFLRNWRTLNLSYARSKNLTPYDVLIIASMIEREAVVPSERPLIAAVIYNRLHQHMPLGIDATIRYGLNVPGTRALTQSELASDNPYNTRKILGLPPTPISNPGLASLQAAANPAKVDYLYFVRKPDHRHHYFTASFQDFVNHEKAYGY